MTAARETLTKIATDALQAWDEDRDSRVGKILAALSGRMPGYRRDVDELLTQLAAGDAHSELDRWKKLGESVQIEHERLQEIAARLGLPQPEDRQGYKGQFTAFDIISALETRLAAPSDAIRQHIEHGDIVRDALRTIMGRMAEGWRGTCGCGELRECSRCQGLDAASDAIERLLRKVCRDVSALNAPTSPAANGASA